MDADICIIMNVGSGKQDAAERRETLDAACARYPGRFTISLVGKGGDIVEETRRAIADGFKTIVAAGGDGTIAAVAECLADTDRRMAVLPFGTFNYFARTLGIPEDIDEAVRLVAEGEVRRFDLGAVNGKIFLNNASLGAYPLILDRRERVFRRWGRSRLMAYLVTALTLLQFRAPLRAVLSVDGTKRRVRTPLIFVSKNAGQLEEVGLDGAECIRGGGFAVFVAREGGRLGLVRFAFRLAMGWSEPREDFELFCGREIEIDTRHKLRLVARDGERARMRGPFRFRLHPGALTIVVPPPASGGTDSGADTEDAA